MLMARVTQIKEINNKRKSIVLDEGISFPLYISELRTYSIVEGEDISQSKLDEIFNVLLPKRAKLRAMNLLKVRPYTKKGLRDKLIEGGYPDSIVDIAISYVEGFHYIDDFQYACDYFYTYKERKNVIRMKQELLSKGVDKDIIEEAYNESFTDECDYEEKQILDILRKKKYISGETCYEDKMKIMASICRKGYSPDKVKRLMSES